MYVGVDEMPDEENSLPVERSWDNGRVYENQLPVNSTVYIMVSTQKRARYSIVVCYADCTIELRASRIVGGIVEDGMWNNYKIHVGDEAANLVVQVTPFSGTPRMYMKAGSPPNISIYDYSWELLSNQTMTITPTERESLGLLTGEYYVSMFGVEHASYTLLATLNEDGFIALTPGMPVTGTVELDTVKHYNLHIAEQKDLNISVYLSPQFGNPDLYVKLCTDPDQLGCLFTGAELEHPEDNGVLYSTRISGPDSLLFRHNASSCTLDSSCNYIVAVKGGVSQRSSYILTLTEEDKAEIVLREGDPVSQTVVKGVYNYFRYTVLNITAITVTFTLNSNTGDADLCITRNGFPSIEEYDKRSRKSVSFTDIIRYEKGMDSEDLLGDYHVAVYSEESCSSL